MSACYNLKNYLLNRCFDLDLIAKKIGKTPENFKNALNEKLDPDDKENINLDDLYLISKIVNDSAENILGIKYL